MLPTTTMREVRHCLMRAEQHWKKLVVLPSLKREVRQSYWQAVLLRKKVGQAMPMTKGLGLGLRMVQVQGMQRRMAGELEQSDRKGGKLEKIQ